MVARYATGLLCHTEGCEREREHHRLMCSKHRVRRKRSGTHMGLVISDTVSKMDFDPKYTGAHQRVRWLWGPARQYECVACGGRAAEWAYDGTDPTHLLGQGIWQTSYYSRYPEFYMPMCIRCHRTKDRAESMKDLAEYRNWMLATGKRLSDER